MRNLDIPYTKLSGDALWNNISIKYMNPICRHYHNMDHVVGMYKYAKKLNFEYDIDLDVAILIHDMIYDGTLNVEIKSVYEFFNMVKNFTKINSIQMPEKVFMPFGVIQPNKIADMVFTTINHRPIRNNDNRLILLDLYGFAESDRVRNVNYSNLFDELINLYPDVNPIDIKYKMRENLIRICTNIVDYTVLNPEDKYYNEWVLIQNGIAAQIGQIEKEIVSDYEYLERQNKL